MVWHPGHWDNFVFFTGKLHAPESKIIALAFLISNTFTHSLFLLLDLLSSDCVEHVGMKDCRPVEYCLITYSVLLGELDKELINGVLMTRSLL